MTDEYLFPVYDDKGKLLGYIPYYVAVEFGLQEASK